MTGGGLHQISTTNRDRHSGMAITSSLKANAAPITENLARAASTLPISESTAVLGEDAHDLIALTHPHMSPSPCCVITIT